MPFTMTDEQQAGATHIYERGETYIIAPMGAGKTVVAYTGAAELLRDGHVKRVLILSTLKICEEVWPHEHLKWEHLCDGEPVALATGKPAARLAALHSDAKMVAINFENLAWLVDQAVFKQFDMLIVDEATKLKSNGTALKSIRRKLAQFNTRVSMTGTPVSENFDQIFYQIMLVDNGASLGRNKQAFLRRYFAPLDFNEYNWALRPECEQELVDAFKHLVVELPDYSDELPPCTEHVRYVLLGSTATDYYQQLERDSVNDDVTADSAAVLVNKLQQVACGFVYGDGESGVFNVHMRKNTALVQACAGAAWPTVIVYQYKEELRRALQIFPNAYQIDQLDAFKHDPHAGRKLLIHPKSAGHGIDLTCASRIVFMSPIWSRDLMRQTIARLYRRGQGSPVEVITLVGKGTVEEEIVRREDEKQTHGELLAARLAARH